MFNIVESEFPGLKQLLPIVRADNRGTFVKTYHQDYFKDNGMDFQITEQYYSVSKKNTVRGMHFQVPPDDHEKLVYCASGKIIDVVIDLREGSPTFKQHKKFKLTSDNAQQLFIPKGFAHGFIAKSDSATVVYNLSTVYSESNDKGIAWDSAGIDWELEGPEIMSERDKELPTLEEFKTPFKF